MNQCSAVCALLEPCKYPELRSHLLLLRRHNTTLQCPPDIFHKLCSETIMPGALLLQQCLVSLREEFTAQMRAHPGRGGMERTQKSAGVCWTQEGHFWLSMVSGVELSDPYQSCRQSSRILKDSSNARKCQSENLQGLSNTELFNS